MDWQAFVKHYISGEVLRTYKYECGHEEECCRCKVNMYGEYGSISFQTDLMSSSEESNVENECFVFDPCFAEESPPQPAESSTTSKFGQRVSIPNVDEISVESTSALDPLSTIPTSQLTFTTNNSPPFSSFVELLPPKESGRHTTGQGQEQKQSLSPPPLSTNDGTGSTATTLEGLLYSLLPGVRNIIDFDCLVRSARESFCLITLWFKEMPP
jgi:hypothetical protein